MNIKRLNRWKGKAVLGKPLPGGMKFDMSEWYHEKPCGSAACAAGFAAMDPIFNAQGLVLFPVDNQGEHMVRCGVLVGFGAIAGFFNISHSDARYICEPDNYPEYDGRPIPRAAVIRHIEEVIRGEV